MVLPSRPEEQAQRAGVLDGSLWTACLPEPPKMQGWGQAGAPGNTGPVPACRPVE